MDKLDPTLLSIAGGVLVFLLTSFFKDKGWTDRQKFILLIIISIVVATFWYLFGLYPTWSVALQQVGAYALIVFGVLVKLLGLKWQQ